MDIKTYLKNSIHNYVDRDLLLLNYGPEDIQFAYSQGWIDVNHYQSLGDYIVYNIAIVK
jgi:hypothetical protein